MSFRRLITAAFVLALAVSAAGQDGEGVRDYRLAKEALPWAPLSNPALMDAFLGRLAMVELQFNTGFGGLASLTESPACYSAGAATESYFRVGDRLTFYGLLNWQYFTGKDMGGPVLMDPYYNPVNFYESSTETVGTRNRERYRLQGGLSYRLGRKWALGANVSYTAADQTKVKDPRFSSVWMDLGVDAGVSWKPSENLTVGASLQYRNTLEMIKGGIYGTTDKQYFIQTDKGAFLGTVAELAGDYNYIPVSEFRPMANQYFGGALQMVLKDRISAEAWFRTRDGYYGRQSSSTATFFEFGGWQAGLRSVLLLPSGSNLHRLSADFSLEKLENRENQFRYVTPTGQSTVVEYTGQSKVLDRLDMAASLDYAWHMGTGGYRPEFILGLKLDGRSRNQSASIFPLSRSQRITTWSADLYGQKNFHAAQSLWTLELHGLAAGGFGNYREDSNDSSAVSTAIKSFDTWLDRQAEYETAFRTGGGIAVEYSLFQWKAAVPYIRISESFLFLTSVPQYLAGRWRNVAMISVGCHF